MSRVVGVFIVVISIWATVHTPLHAITTPKNTPLYYEVFRVIDGDTFEIGVGDKRQKIRPIGIDTPETVDPRKTVQCFGKEASKRARELLLNKKVRLEKDITQADRDKYGRLLRYVYLQDGVFFNKYMIAEGYAHEYTYIRPYKYQSEFKKAQNYAKNNERGLWSSETCQSSRKSVR